MLFLIVKRTGAELVLSATLPKLRSFGVTVNGVGPPIGVGEAVGVDVAVRVDVAVFVGVGVFVGVAVFVGVGLRLAVGVGPVTITLPFVNDTGGLPSLNIKAG